MTQTYNPILERTDVPTRLFKSRVSAPELGTAVVVVRKAAEPIVAWHGHHLPPTKIGEHRRYVIDIASHGLSFQMRAASANPVFPFAVTVELACRVLNPYTIARDNIQERNTEAEIKLQALRIAMGGNLEDMDVADVQRAAFNNIFGDNGNGGKQETMRERIARRSKGAIESPQVVEGSTQGTAEKAGGGPAEKPASARPENKAPSEGT